MPGHSSNKLGSTGSLNCAAGYQGQQVLDTRQVFRQVYEFTYEYRAMSQQLETIVDLEGTLNAELLLIKYYLNKNMFTSANARIQTLSTRYPEVNTISGFQNQLASFLAIFQPAVSDTLFVLDSTHRQILINSSQQADFPVNLWAENLLNSLSIDYPAEQYIFPGEYKTGQVRIRPVPDNYSSNSGDNRLSIYPNPATNHVVVRYNLPEDSVEKNLLIRSLDGKILDSFTLPDNDNQKVVFIGNLPIGLYLMELIADGQLISTEKVSIVR